MAPNYEFLYIQYKDCNKILISCPKEDVLDQKIHIQRMHALINKMDKGDSMLETFTANELAQLTVLHFERQIKFMSD